MPRPRQSHTLATGAEFLANRHHVGERLTRMMHRGFEIDDRHRSVFREGLEHWIRSFFLPVFQRRERSHADRDAVSFEHADKLGDVFGFVAVHNHAIAMFESPARAAGFEYDRIAAEFVDTDLHRCACAQTRIEEDQSHGFPAEGLGLIVAVLEAQGRADHVIEVAVESA
jgi:hypothetical protein